MGTYHHGIGALLFNSYEIGVFRLSEICYTKYSYSAKREELDYEITDA